MKERIKPPPPPQFKAKMRPLRRMVKFPRLYIAFVGAKLRIPPLIQRSPLAQTPEAVAKIVRPLIFSKLGLTFRRFSLKSRPLPSFDYHTTKGYRHG